MASTSSNPTASKATASKTTMAGQGGDMSSARSGLKAKVAAGVVALGCAAALALGGLGTGEPARTPAQALAVAPVAQASDVERQQFLESNLGLPPATSTVPAAQAVGVDRQRFLEANLGLPGVTPPDAGTTVERQHFLEQNLAPYASLAPAALDWERLLFLEQNLLPDQANTAAGGARPVGSVDHAGAPRPPSAACLYASADGIPGEGCTAARPTVLRPADAATSAEYRWDFVADHGTATVTAPCDPSAESPVLPVRWCPGGGGAPAALPADPPFGPSSDDLVHWLALQQTGR